VVIAVASPHRAAACAASRFLIDELKASLPIWKKEHYGDGSEWVGDRS
jgi:molybdopterin synthase catalytic subunit